MRLRDMVSVKKDIRLCPGGVRFQFREPYPYEEVSLRPNVMPPRIRVCYTPPVETVL